MQLNAFVPNNPSLSRNIAASYVSQIYASLIGIVVFPLYAHLMGVEGFGLIAFFVALQAWMQLLDIGLTPTIAREAARYRAGATSAIDLTRLLRALELIFLIIGCIVAISIFVASEYLATKWLRLEAISSADAASCIRLMAVTLALRWVSTLYRGLLTGLEQIVWLSGFSILFATLRFVAVVPIILFVSSDPISFFWYQVVIAIIEALVLVVTAYRSLPLDSQKSTVRENFSALKRTLAFSLSVAFTSSVWVLITQLDKLALSKLLLLSEYAIFTLSALLASGIILVSSPISTAILPRLVKLVGEGNENGFRHLYRISTQLAGVIAIPVTAVLVTFSEQVMFVWIGDRAMAATASPILMLYAIGNGIFVFNAYPYYVQFAKGKLQLHLIGNLLFLITWVPGLVWATINFGAIGAGYSWILANLLYFVAWVPLVHATHVPGLHGPWLRVDVLPICVVAALVAVFCKWMLGPLDSRIACGLVLGAVGLSLVVACTAASPYSRGRLLELISRIRQR